MRSSSKPTVVPRHALGSLLRHEPVRWAPGDLSQYFESESIAEEIPVHVTPVADDADTEVRTQELELQAAEAARQAEIEQQELQVKEAYAAGFEEGRLEGEIAEGVRLRNAISAAETALDEIRTHEGKWQNVVSENIAALAIAVARHIVGRELHSDAATVADLVKRALAEFPIDQPMRIRVNPVDLSLLSMLTSNTGEPVSIAPNRDVRWMADARIEPGGCIVEGRERIVDGRVDTGLERLYRRLSHTDA